MKKAVLITGCSTGIGLAACHILQDQGYHVFATARKPEDVDRLNALKFDSLQLDLNDSQSIQTALATILDKTDGKLYGLVNNAGFGQIGALEDITRDLIRSQFETNVFGLLELTNSVIPVMRKQKEGRIINVSSILGYICLPYRGAYNASKFAVEGLSDTWRLELANTGIGVSLIEPGPIATHFRHNSIEKIAPLTERPSVHQDNYIKLLSRAKNQKRPPIAVFTLPPLAVGKKILQALESKNPRPRYRVTVPAHIFAYLKRFLSTRMLDRILRAVSYEELKNAPE